MHLWSGFSFHIRDYSQKILEVIVDGACKQNLIHLFIQNHFLSAHCVSGTILGSWATSVNTSHQDLCSRTPEKCELEQEQPAFGGLWVVFALRWGKDALSDRTQELGGSPGKNRNFVAGKARGSPSPSPPRGSDVGGRTPRKMGLDTKATSWPPNCPTDVQTQQGKEEHGTSQGWGSGSQEPQWQRPPTGQRKGCSWESLPRTTSAPSGARRSQGCIPGPERAAWRMRSIVMLSKEFWKRWRMPQAQLQGLLNLPQAWKVERGFAWHCFPGLVRLKKCHGCLRWSNISSECPPWRVNQGGEQSAT